MANKYYLCTLHLLLLYCCMAGGETNKKNILELEKEILDRLLNSSVYDARVRPLENNKGTSPTRINVNMFVITVNRVDDVRMQYNAQLFLRQKWMDERLKFDNTQVGIKALNLFDETIWTPDLFIGNERSGYMNNLMKPNRFTRIYPDGKIFSSARITLVLACPMDFKYYPFDTQICSIRLESYGYTTEDVVYEWDEEKAVVAKEIDFTNYNLQKVETRTNQVKIATGTYIGLVVDFHLKRKLAHHVFHLFLPTIMLVMTSWVTFWLDHQFTLTRVFLVVTTILVLGYKVSDFNSTLPPVTYTRSVDVWTITCMLYVFAAILEVVIVDYKRRHTQKQQRHTPGVLETIEEENSSNIDMNPLVSNTNNTSADNFQQYNRMGRMRNYLCRPLSTLSPGPENLDNTSRVLFPISFLLFNIFFWFINLV